MPESRSRHGAPAAEDRAVSDPSRLRWSRWGGVLIRVCVVGFGYLAACYVAGFVSVALMAASTALSSDSARGFDDLNVVQSVLFVPVMGAAVALWVAAVAIVPWGAAVLIAVLFELRSYVWAAAMGAVAGASPLLADLRRVDGVPSSPPQWDGFWMFLAMLVISGICAGLTFRWIAGSSLWPSVRAVARDQKPAQSDASAP